MKQVIKKTWALFNRHTNRIYSGIYTDGGQSRDGPMFFFNPYHAQVYRDTQMPCPNAFDNYRVGIVNLIETDSMDKYDQQDLNAVNTKPAHQAWRSFNVRMDPIDKN